MNTRQKLLLLGGGGKLGSEITSRIAPHFEVIAPHRRECDITKMDEIKRKVREVEPDTILNTAALVGAKECESNRQRAWDTNVTGAANVARVCRDENIRLVFTSSAAVFDGEKGNYTEDDPPSPTFYYATTKVAAEQAVAMVPNHAIIRLDFFPLTKLKHAQVFADHYTSKIPVTAATTKTLQIAGSTFVGIINIGQDRNNLYDILKPYFPEISSITIAESSLPNFPRDISLDLTKWKKLFE